MRIIKAQVMEPISLPLWQITSIEITEKSEDASKVMAVKAKEVGYYH